MTKTIHN